MARKPGSPATPAQKAALERGRKARAEMLKAGGESVSERWARLLDGSLTVRELSDEEIKKGKLKGRGGSTSKRSMPSHLVKAFGDERLRRANEGLARLLPIAVETYKQLMQDPEASAADRQRIAKDIIERNLGKTPDRIHLGADDPFGAALREVLIERDLDDLLDEDAEA